MCRGVCLCVFVGGASVTPEAINEAVARKMGLELHEGMDINSYKERLYLPDNSPILDYCHDIKATWTVVDHLRNRGIDINLFIHREGVMISWKYDSIVAYADTAPMAICLAFLALKESL